MTSHDALARCVGDVERFVADHWDRAPLHRPAADAGGFTDLLSVDDCDRLLTASGLRAPAFRLVRDGRTVAVSQVTRTARIGSRSVSDLVDVDAVLAEVADGATLVLQGLQRSWPPVAALCADLEASLTHPVQANAYLTPPTAAGLDVHADSHDVLVLHTHGAKQWVVHAEASDRGANAAPWDLRLQPGDVLYLPRGTRHAARTTETASLHLTIGIKTITWRDVARRALEQAESPTLDRALPPGLAGQPDELAEAIAAELPALAKSTADVDASAVAATVRRTAGGPAPGRGRLQQVLALDTIDDATWLCGVPGVVADIDGGADLDAGADIDACSQVVVRTADRQLRLPGWTAPAVHRALSGQPLTPAALADHLDHAGRLVLVRRLVREGLLARTDPDAR